ncbi:MAG TPA: LuxR C-terminal-related transcriptional regulator [Pseudonocardiaceae bacterium]|nr:LuxR C-terminal-related transcriptional regulator [Pseudonocardiaceae bacterium]
MSPRLDAHPDPAAGLATRLVSGPVGSALLITGGVGAGRSTLARRVAAVPPAATTGFLPVRLGAATPMWLGREIVRLLAARGTVRPAGPAEVLAALAARGGDGRTLLVVDDVHLADRDGAEILTALVRARADLGLRLALTAPDGWPDRVPAGLAAALADLPRHELSAVDLAGVVDHATDVLGVPPADPFAAELFARTGGNVAALHGVLTDALAKQAVVVIDRQAWLSPRHRLGLPADHPLPRRLAELPGAAADVAEVLAVAGPAVDVARECGMAGADVQRAVDTLVAAGLLADSELIIPVLADAVAERVVPWRRAELQSRVLPAGSGLVGHVVGRGQPMRPADLRALPATDDAVTAQLLPWCGPVPPQDVAVPAIRHWARTGNWAAIVALPPDAVPAESLVDRVRAVLRTSGRIAALSDVDVLARSIGDDTCAVVRAELLAYDATTKTSTAPPEHPALAADAAFEAWQRGRWDEVLALAVADRLTGAAAHALCTAEESAALAADIWLHRVRPELARRWLDDATPPPDDAAPRPLTEWARAGLDLQLRKPRDAVDRLTSVLAWMADSQQDRHRDLLLLRCAIALTEAGDTEAAADRLAELGGEGHDRLLRLQATVAIAERGGDRDDRETPAAYLAEAQARESPFDVARAQLRLAAVTGDAELALTAAAGFAALDATLWQVRATSTARELGLDSTLFARNAGVGDVIGELVAAGLSNADIGAVLRRDEAYVKRQVSRLLRATNSNQRAELIARTRPPSAPRADERSGDPVAALLAAGPVAMLVGPPGSGRRTTMTLLQTALAAGRTTPVIVVRVDGAQVRRERRDVASAVLYALGAAVSGVSGPISAALAATGGAVADAAADVLRTVSRTRPVAVLLDDADEFTAQDRSQLGVLGAAATGRCRLVLSGNRFWTWLADVAGSPVPLPAWGATQTAAAIAEQADEWIDPATAGFVAGRVGGRPGVLRELLLAAASPSNAAAGNTAPTEAMRGGVLPPGSPALRGLPGVDTDAGRCVALLGALADPRLPEVEPALAAIGLPPATVRAVCTELLADGTLVSTMDGRLTFAVPLIGESVAATADPGEVRALHRSLADAMLADRHRGVPVDYRALAEHIVGAGATLGQTELAEFAERVAPTDPGRAQRWCAALLAAPPADEQLAGRVTVVSAHTLYDLARFPEAAQAARRALDLLPEQDSLDARTTLINSLLRIGDHDAALGVATEDGQTARSVPDGMQQARILLLRERFDEALGVLSALRPADRQQRVALVTGVRMLAAIGADGGRWRDAEQHADAALSPLTPDQVDTVRTALAWGDLYTSERAVMPGTMPSPAARRKPPPSMARLSAAADALREGHWPAIAELYEQNTADAAEQTYVDGLLRALAVEALVRRGQLDDAELLLRTTSAEQLFGHIIAWAGAGVLLARGDHGEAIDLLRATDRRCRALGYLTGRELVLARWVDACVVAKDTAAAEAVSRDLGRLAARVATVQATLYWLVSRLAIQPDEHTVRSAEQLARRYGDPFLAARVRFHEADLGRPDALRAAHAEFRRLGAADWQRRAADSMTAQRMSTRVAETIGESDRRLIELIAAGATNQQAAAELGVSEKAIEARLTRLYRRTGLRSRVALVREYGGDRRTDTA